MRPKVTGKPRVRDIWGILVMYDLKEQRGPDIGPSIVRKALELNEKLGGSADFKARTGWLKNFKSCHRIQELQIEGESLSCDKNSAYKFKETFLQHVEEGYSRDDVDDFSVMYLPPNITAQECDEEDVETWMACNAENCGFQMQNDDEIVTFVQEKSNPINVEMDDWLIE
ncbi:HTH CENPB-type domain-containing protein [Trichonephila clavipes]|nr:HTH CENPB-type domain-containing protein [Trichonephila clavipes]